MNKIICTVYNSFKRGAIKKKLTTLMLVFVSIMSFNMSVVASSVTEENIVLIDEQSQLDETLDIVFEFLNKQPVIKIGTLVDSNYTIPINEGYSVNVNIENKEVPKGRASFPSEANKNYKYSVTISNIRGSGTVVHNVHYSTGDYYDGTTILTLSVRDVTVSYIAPDKWTTKSSSNKVLEDTTGYNKTSSVTVFERSFYSDENVTIIVSMSSSTDSNLLIDYDRT